MTAPLPTDKLSPNFTVSELTRTDLRQYDNTPNEAELKNLTRTAALLEQVRTLVDKPIMINSAFRSKQVNDAVGSKDSSQHRIGCAADIRIPGMNPDEIVRKIQASKIEFDQLIREFWDGGHGGWTHISVANTAKTKPRRQVLIIDRKGARPFS
jgi:hypothetical protein